MSDLFISKREWVYLGNKVGVGEVVEPQGSPRDSVLFGDNTHWTTRFFQVSGAEPLVCGSDGCARRFATLGQLDRHRAQVHAPEREDRVRFRQERLATALAREEAGETIGGHPVDKVVRGPRGDVPYVKI